MIKYIENVNAHLSQMKIKQTYINLKAGIDNEKMSRILNREQDVTGSDMKKIASALGKTVEFFLNELVKLVENIDEVLSAKARFVNLPEE